MRNGIRPLRVLVTISLSLSGTACELKTIFYVLFCKSNQQSGVMGTGMSGLVFHPGCKARVCIQRKPVLFALKTLHYLWSIPKRCGENLRHTSLVLQMVARNSLHA